MRDRWTAVCFDLDSTVANTAHRRHLLPEDRAEGSHWLAYSAACEADAPIEGTIRLMQLLSHHHQIHIVSGRSAATAQEKTERWLRRHGAVWDELALRSPADETLANDALKIRYVRALQDSGVPVVLFVEDWVPVAEAIRAQTGVPVLVVNPCDPPELAAGTAPAYARGGV